MMENRHIYDTVLIGCGYFSVGYAVARGNCLICEENQICDNRFYLPLNSFRYHPYSPKTDEGARLLKVFDRFELFKDGQQNTNGFECAFCKYITETDAEILLKCRVIGISGSDGAYDVRIQTNEGISHLYAKKVINTLSELKNKTFTILFTTENPEAVSAELTAAFRGAVIEPAFYKGRYALHIPADDHDENTVKLAVYNVWNERRIGAKIVYMAPIFSSDSESPYGDGHYNNPIEAFEAGYLYAKEKE